MIYTKRTITIGDLESYINEPVILYRRDGEVDLEFVIMKNNFNFIDDTTNNASFGQFVIVGPTNDYIFSGISECKDGSVIFTITKDMIDEMVEVGNYTFQIRLFDQSQSSRITIPPVYDGIVVRNPLVAEDETDIVEEGVVGYSVIRKDGEENLDTFLPSGEYNKTEWKKEDVITTGRLNKIEDALYSINANTKESDVFLLNALNEVNSQLTHNEKHLNCAYVKDYTDNDSIDDTETIQNAINSLKDKKRKSYLVLEENKTYVINSPLIIDFSNVVIEGNNSTITTTSVSLNAFFINGFSDKQYTGYEGNINLEFKDLTLDAKGVVSSGICVAHSKNLKVSNCKFIDFTSHGLDIAGVDGVLVENNAFEGFAGDYDLHREAIQIDVCLANTFPYFGVYDKTTTKNVIVKNNVFKESINRPIWGKCVGCHSITISALYESIKIYNNNFKAKEVCVSFYRTEFKNVEIFNNIMSCEGDGILLEGTPNAWSSPKEDLERINIFNNKCLEAKSFIKIMTYTNYIKNVFISNNDVNFHEHGAYIVFYGATADLKEDNLRDIIIENNKFTSYGTSVSEALQVDRITNLLIKSNTFTNILNTCIQSNSSKNCVISNNLMHNIKGYGVEMKGDLYNINIENNIIDNTNKYGILCGYGSTNSKLIKISNNKLINIGMFNADTSIKRSIGVFASSSVDVKGNIIEITDNETDRLCCPDTLIFIDSTCVNTSITDNILDAILYNHPHRDLISDKTKKAFISNNIVKTDGYINYNYILKDENGTSYVLKIQNGSLIIEEV